MSDIETKMRNARTAVSSARMGIRQTQKDLERFEKLEQAYNYLREYGADINVIVRFGASAVGHHDTACEVVKALLTGDWANEKRREVTEAIQAEMLEISERLS